MIKTTSLITMALLLTGCSDKMLPTEVLQEIPDTVENVSKQGTKKLGLITSVSLGKEITVRENNKEIILGYFDAVAKAGTEVKMKQVTKSVSLDGKILTWTEEAVDYFKYTPTPGTEWVAKLPDKPSDHAGWAFATNAWNTAWKFGTLAFGIDRVTGMVSDLAGQATYSYTNSPIVQSQNTAGTSQDYVTDFYNNSDDFSGGSDSSDVSEYPNDTWYSEGCSVDSHAAGDC